MGDTFQSDNYRNIHVPLVLARNQNFLVFETVLIRPYVRAQSSKRRLLREKHVLSQEEVQGNIRTQDYTRERNQPVYFCFIDFTKTFDRVRHDRVMADHTRIFSTAGQIMNESMQASSFDLES